MDSPNGRDARFAPTRWSLVLAARPWPAPEAAVALGALYERYWYPLYAAIRRQGYTPEDAQDLTQAFFVHLIEQETLQRVQQDKGRFRTFLLAALGYFLRNERDRALTRKRGGGQVPLSWDLMQAEARFDAEPPETMTPERHFERRWALQLVAGVLDRLEREYAASDRAAVFAALEQYLTSPPASGAIAAVAARLGTSEGAVKVALHRMRRRFGELLRAEVAQTLANPADIQEELRHLCAALAD
jgi:RNA polymerase sigma-70 factor (ECF subfamily)